MSGKTGIGQVSGIDIVGMVWGRLGTVWGQRGDSNEPNNNKGLENIGDVGGNGDRLIIVNR